MNKFSLADPKTGLRWDFEVHKDRTVTVGLPSQRVEHRTQPLDFDPRKEFDGDADTWIEWGADVLLTADLVIFDEDFGLITQEALDEARIEAIWEAEHIRQESDPWKYH